MRATRAACLLLAATLAVGLSSCAELQTNLGGGPLAGTSSAAAAPVPTAVYNISSLLDPASGKFLGVYAPGAPYSLTPVGSFAASLGRKPNLIGTYIGWNSAFDAQAVSNAWSYGALPYLAWEPYGTTLQAIAQGASDAYITRFARAVRALNLPVAISFGHEMNGWWYPWGTAKTTAAQFVAAWRHIHDLFVAAGATNVIWVWNPNVITAMPQIQLEPYYPGNAYVDWIGVTGYFAATGPHSYAGLYQPTMAEIRQFSSKPFIIAETAVQTGPDEIASVNNLVATVTEHSDVLGFAWFDYNKDGVDWRIESRPAVRATLAQDVASLPLVNPK